MHFLLGVDSALTGYETQSRSDTTLLCETHHQCFTAFFDMILL